MNLQYRMCLLIGLGLFSLCPSAKGQEAHVDQIVSQVLDTQEKIVAAAKDRSVSQFVFLAFWDFDGTILKGDCSEGLKQEETVIYKGLARLAIDSGYSEIYSGQGGADRFWKDYRHMEHHISKWLAYPFIPQMLRGAPVRDIQALSEKHFAEVLRQYYFQASIQLLNALQEMKVQCHILSASADIFVDAAAPTLGMDVKRFSGIELEFEDGRLTERLVYPVTWAEGKTKKLVSIVETIKRQNPDKEVVVLAAFGNSYSTDGPFMKHVATQNLVAGKPTVVMINGGEPPETYGNLFTRVQQSETVPTH